MYLRLVEKQCVKMVFISVSVFYEIVTVLNLMGSRCLYTDE